MNRKLSYSGVLAILGCLFLSLFSSCKEDVDLPQSFLDVDKPVILAPYAEISYTLQVDANCTWEALVNAEDESWVKLSSTKSSGSFGITVSLSSNTTAERTTKLLFRSVSDHSIFKEVEIKQYGKSQAGYVPIKDIRSLSANLSDGSSKHDIAEDWKVKGIIISDAKESNYPANSMAIQDGTDKLSGIRITGNNPHWNASGQEVEVQLKGSSLQYGADGTLEVILSDDKNVVPTELMPGTLTPIEVDYAALISGDYESMYVSVSGYQVEPSDLSGVMEGFVGLQDENGDRVLMYTYSTAVFVTDKVPTGNGVASGIVAKMNNDYAILPSRMSDLNMTGQRLSSGITFPYIFSLLCAGDANADGPKYLQKTGNDKEPEKQIISTLDGLGVTLTFHDIVGKGDEHQARYWHENSGHHNIPVKSWNHEEADKPHLLLTFPLGVTIDKTFRFSFGIGCSGTGPKNWRVMYSSDGETWTNCDNNQISSIPTGASVSGGKNFFYFSVFITPKIPLKAFSTLYIKISPNDNESVTGGIIAEKGEPRFHSAFVLDQKPETVTSFPEDAIYAEGFDRIFGGYDYLHGELLSGMVAYSGKDISTWSTEQCAGLTGSNVRERVGYVQIGYSDTEKLAPSALTNNVGSLITPKLTELTEATDVTLSFKAMAYKTMAKKASNGKDLAGDITRVKVEVVGGGTINGSTSAVIKGLNYSSFTDLSVDIEGATPNTQVIFTSDPTNSEFSRWFLDDICIVKK